MSAPDFGLYILPYVPAMMAEGRRSTTSRGSAATEPSLGAGRLAGAGGSLQHPRGGAVRRGFNSRGRPRVVLGSRGRPGELLQR
jgi:hypothetical protein